jgi:P-type conjugative transfer protein TrbL
MRNRVFIPVLSALVTLSALSALVWVSAAFAADSASAPIDNFIQNFMSLRDRLTAGGGLLYRAALKLFWTLALIQLTWSGIRLALRGDWGLSSITAVLVRNIMFIGFFYWLLTQSANNALVTMISGGLRAIGSDASIPATVSPADFFFNCVHALYSLTDTAFKLGVYNSVWAAAPYALTLVVLSFASAFAVVYLLEYIIVVPAGVILMGMGGTVWSKKFVTNYVRVLISVGFKLFFLQIVFFIANPYISNAQVLFANANTIASEGFFQHIFNFAGFSTVVFLSIKTIPQFAANLVSGASFDLGNWDDSAAYVSSPYVSSPYGGGSGPRGAGENGGGSEFYAIASSGQAPAGVMGTVNLNGAGGERLSSMTRDAGRAEEAAKGSEQTRFKGAGFGNYAHDLIFDEEGGAGGPSPQGRGPSSGGSPPLRGPSGAPGSNVTSGGATPLSGAPVPGGSQISQDLQGVMPDAGLPRTGAADAGGLGSATPLRGPSGTPGSKAASGDRTPLSGALVPESSQISQDLQGAMPDAGLPHTGAADAGGLGSVTPLRGPSGAPGSNAAPGVATPLSGAPVPGGSQTSQNLQGAMPDTGLPRTGAADAGGLGSVTPLRGPSGALGSNAAPGGRAPLSGAPTSEGSQTSQDLHGAMPDAGLPRTGAADAGGFGAATPLRGPSGAPSSNAAPGGRTPLSGAPVSEGSQISQDLQGAMLDAGLPHTGATDAGGLGAVTPLRGPSGALGSNAVPGGATPLSGAPVPGGSQISQDLQGAMPDAGLPRTGAADAGGLGAVTPLRGPSGTPGSNAASGDRTPLSGAPVPEGSQTSQDLQGAMPDAGLPHTGAADAGGLGAATPLGGPSASEGARSGRTSLSGSGGVPGRREEATSADSGIPGLPGSRGNEGLPDAQSGAGLPDARGNEGLPDAKGNIGLPDARGGAGLPDARGNEGLPDARGGEGLPDARGNEGLPDARGGEGLPDARPSDSGAVSAAMRKTIRDSLMGGDGKS